MQSANPYRNSPEPACIELRCHACAKPFLVPEPTAVVSLTRCPRPSCQHVALVCTQAALADSRWPWLRERCVALDLEAFVEGRADASQNRAGLLDVLVALLLFFTLFLLTPLVMLGYTWSLDLELFFAVASLTAPSLLIGVAAVIAGAGDLWSSGRRRRGLRRVRAEGFARAPWLTAEAKAG